MSDESAVLPFSADYLTLALLLVSLGIFVLLAFRAGSLKSFQFQTSVFIVVMVMAEIINLEKNQGFIQLPPSLEELGYEIHLGSMVFFCLMLWLRFYYSKKSGTSMVEEILEKDSP